jgi:hypothetical protein
MARNLDQAMVINMMARDHTYVPCANNKLRQ